MAALRRVPATLSRFNRARPHRPAHPKRSVRNCVPNFNRKRFPVLLAKKLRLHNPRRAEMPI